MLPPETLAALAKIGVTPTPAQQNQLADYVQHLKKWNKTYNLIGKSTENEIYQRHIADSLQLIPFIQNSNPIYDIGAGAGLPGIPLAICLANKVHLIEPRQNRVLFLNQVVRSLGLNHVTVHQSNAQDMFQDQENPCIITARAVAPIETLLCWTQIKPQYKYVFLKGKDVEKEISTAQTNLNVTIHSHPSITSTDARIVEIQ